MEFERLRGRNKFRWISIRLLLAAPAVWALLVDVFFTVVFQDPEYWSGNLEMANEGNPFGAAAMGQSVYGVFLMSGWWLLMILLFTVVLPFKIARVFAVAVLLGQTYGATTWIMPRYGFWLAVALWAVNAALFFIFYDLHVKRKNGLSQKPVR